VIAVSDTSTIFYLVLIGEIELLPTLFDLIAIPPGVATELSDPGAPAALRDWWQEAPSWVRVENRDLEAPPEELRRLHRGEREAILLARRIGADTVLLDEKAGRRAAKTLGLPVMGLIGILAMAAELGRVNLPQAVERLRSTNFRVSPDLLKGLLDSASREEPEGSSKM
jgi:predicted nucleic acid-binding protein